MPLNPCVADEPVSVAVVLLLSNVKVLATAAPAAALICVMLEKPPVGLGEPAVVPVYPVALELVKVTFVAVV